MRINHNVVITSPAGVTVAHHKTRYSARKHVEAVTAEWQALGNIIEFWRSPVDYRRRRRQQVIQMTIGFEVGGSPTAQTYGLFYDPHKVRD